MRLIHQQIQYLEFLSRDLERIKAFYIKAFGWEFTDYSPQYAAFSGEYVDGGFTAGDPVKGSILPILYSTALSETLEKVRDAEGTILQDIFEFPGGRRFHFEDPDENELAVWSDV